MTACSRLLQKENCIDTVAGVDVDDDDNGKRRIEHSGAKQMV